MVTGEITYWEHIGSGREIRISHSRFLTIIDKLIKGKVYTSIVFASIPGVGNFHIRAKHTKATVKKTL